MSPRHAAVTAGLHLETALAEAASAAASGRAGEGTALVAGMDEVGRGAMAGPVVVGAVAVPVPAADQPPPVRDSKALTDRRRRLLVPQIRDWAAAVGLGEASPAEIDEHGLSTALALAGRRAWAALCRAVEDEPVALILDGRDDWLSRGAGSPAVQAVGGPVPPRPQMVVKAEDQAATVAGASIVAKVYRDDLMIALHEEFPAYGWAGNKGYGSAGHREALERYGAVDHHRRSWALPVRRVEEPTLFGEERLWAPPQDTDPPREGGHTHGR